jgi:hypothetical protein
MAVHDYITKEELENASEDNQTAFADLVAIADKRRQERWAALDQHDGSYAYEEIEHGFMNVVIGLAKAYKLEPFASMEVPRRSGFRTSEFDDFKADLDHYLTQLMVSNTIRDRQSSVPLSPPAKEKIRDYLRALRDQIDKSDFPDAKKADLHDRLSEFEAALEKPRLNLFKTTLLVLNILALPGGLWASYDIVAKLTQNVLEVVAEAKAIDDENRRLAPTEQPAILLPPRKEDFGRPNASGGSLADELDDEIPF